MVFTITRVTAIPLPCAPINGIFGAPTFHGPLAIPLAPTLFFRTLDLPVSHPGLKVLHLGRRIQILRYEYILSRCITAGAKQASHLNRHLGTGQGISQTCQDQSFSIFGQGRVLHTQSRDKLAREPRARGHSRLRFLSQHFEVHEVRVHSLARALEARNLHHILGNRINGVRCEELCRIFEICATPSKFPVTSRPTNNILSGPHPT